MAGEAEILGLENISNELSLLSTDVRSLKDEKETKMRELATGFDGVKAESEGVRGKVDQIAAQLTEIVGQIQNGEDRIRELSTRLDSPIFGTDKDRSNADRENAIGLQRALHSYRGKPAAEFVVNESDLIDMSAYRSAAIKLQAVGPVKREDVAKTFTADETRAFEASGLAQGFIVPQLLGLVVDCNVECASLIDLYGSVSVSRSQFRYLKVEDYGAMGSYSCPAACDAEIGPEGNMRWVDGNTKDFRGLFCLNREVVQEANVDLLAFIIDGAQRSYRINRNRAYMVGDGVNEPAGWLTSGAFEKRNTRILNHLDYVDVRLFLGSILREYGRVVPVMHQNVFAYLVSQTDANGRLVFGDGQFGLMPEAMVDVLRISNCLPDPTENLTIGNNNFVSGSFVMAAAAWDVAYKSFVQTPLFFEQWLGGSTAWCVKYQFGAKDGGFIGCPAAGNILQIQ